MAFFVVHYVYIIYSTSIDKYYIGESDDVDFRLFCHNHPIEGRKFTVRGSPWELKISVLLPTRLYARSLEKFLKRMKSRKFVERFISDESFRNEIIKKAAPDC